MATGTYDAHLATDRDWVRFLTGDRVGPSPNFVFSDEELDAVLVMSPSKYCAAAEVLDSMRTTWVSTGIKSKSVEGLSITFNSPADMDKRISALKAKCAEESMSSPRLFRVLV